MKIPSNKNWSQDNSGDTFGTLGETLNMALDTAGRAILAKKAVSIYSNAQDEDFGFPIAIDYFDAQYVVLTDDGIFTGTAPEYAMSQLTWPPGTFLGSDAVVFNGLYTITTTSSIYTWNGGSTSGDWVNRSVSLTSAIQHPLAVFGIELAVGDGNLVKLLSTSYVTNQTLTLPTEFRVTSIRAVNNLLYIGTQNLNGGNAKIFVWNGVDSDFDYEIEVGSHWVFSMTPYFSTVAAITSQGQLGYANGTNFEELAGLPVYFDPHARWQGSGGLTLNGKVFNRGMVTVGDTIYINIEGDTDSGFISEMKSGIWVYDPAVGLYHRASTSVDNTVSDTSLSLSDNTITTSAAHKLRTGDMVVFSSVAGITGLSVNIPYYVSVVSSTEIKLARSRKALQKGNFVTITGTPTSADLNYCQNTEYSTTNTTSGAITTTVSEETPRDNLTSEILWGGRTDTVGGTTRYSIYSFADSLNIGHFITQRIYSDNIAQNWINLYQFIDGIIVDSEEVVLKLQTKFEEPSQEIEGVWLDENTINNNNVTDFTLYQDIEIGDELVFTDGYGRGYSAHVTGITESTNTVSITVDENIGTANQTMKFYRTTFKKVGQALNVNNKDKEVFKSAVADQVKSSPWCKIKVELRGFTPSVNVLDLENKVNRQG